MKNRPQAAQNGPDRLADLLQHADWLRGLAHNLVKDGFEAEDVFQEALLAASGSSAPSDVPERVWLVGVLTNVARGRRRRGARRLEREQRVAAERHRTADARAASGAADDAVLLEQQQSLLRHVESLPDAQRSAVLARFYEGLPPRKIAQRAGVGVSTINSRIQRGLETLRSQLDAEHGDRRTWAAWILPLARRAPGVKLPAAAVGLAVAVGALIVMGTTWALLATPREHLGVDTTPAAVRLAAVQGEGDSIELVAPSGTAAPAPRTAGAPAATVTPHARRLNVRVQDSLGREIESGLSIGANARVDMPPDPRLISEDHESYESSPLVNGLASFGNPWASMTFSGIAQGPETWELFGIHRVYIEGPGLAEFEPGAAQSAAFFPLQPGEPEDMERTLTLPPRGTVRLEISDTDGRRIQADGAAELVFPGVGHFAGGRERSYRTPITAGVAEWPSFVTGSRAFEVRIELPALGASWAVDAVGPERDLEVVTVRTRRPRRLAITARLVDEAGDPLQIDVVDLQLTSPGLSPFVGVLIRASSGSDGLVRFELDGTRVPPGPLPPFAIHAYRSELVGSPESLSVCMLDAIRLWESPSGDATFGVDLGDVILRFEPRVELRGQVIETDGTPVAGATVIISTPGANAWSGYSTDDTGAFSLTASVRLGSTIEVSVPGGPFMAYAQDLAPGTEELVVVLGRGASFRGKIDVGDIGLPERALMVVLTSEDDAELSRAFWADETGAFEGGPVPAGTYTAVVRHQGGQTMATFPGVHVGTTGRFRDTRLDGLKLSDHFRNVKTTWSGTSLSSSPQAVISPHDKSGGHSHILMVQLRDGLILPTRLGASVSFRIGDQFVRVEDVSTIGDTLHIEFETPIEFVLLIDGTPRATDSYTLMGESGSSAEGYTTVLSEEAIRSGEVRVTVPSPGHYRLHVQEKGRPIGGGAVMTSFQSQPVGQRFEIVQSEGGSDPQTVRVSITR